MSYPDYPHNHNTRIVLRSSELKRVCYNFYTFVFLSVFGAKEKTNQSISTKFVKSVTSIIDAIRLQHKMLRVVIEAAGRTLVEGERGRRPSRGWVSMQFFEFNTIYCIENSYFHFFITKRVRKLVLVLGTVYFNEGHYRDYDDYKSVSKLSIGVECTFFKCSLSAVILKRS